MSALLRNNVNVEGHGPTTIMFSHGFGCDQNMWRYVAPAFAADYRVVLFDHVGSGRSDISTYDAQKYGRLEGYADDIIEIGRELDVQDAIFVGHSVSAMIGMLAARDNGQLFKSLVLVGPSPCYVNDGDYVGGFERHQIDELLEALDSNHLGWSMTMAPVIMGNPDRQELSDELANSFCRTDPDIARHFARTTFLSDYRHLLAQVETPALILQCSRDVIAPEAVGRFMHERMPNSELVIMRAMGHCPNLSAPQETIDAIKGYIQL